MEEEDEEDEEGKGCFASLTRRIWPVTAVTNSDAHVSIVKYKKEYEKRKKKKTLCYYFVCVCVLPSERREKKGEKKKKKSKRKPVGGVFSLSLSLGQI